jgi:hypothetical protein
MLHPAQPGIVGYVLGGKIVWETGKLKGLRRVRANPAATG